MAPVAVGNKPQYHLTLSDGEAVVGLMAASAGNIRQLPRSTGVERKSLVQQSWAGGRGNELYSKDQTRYYDGGSIWTVVANYAFNGPLLRYGRGHRSLAQSMPGNVTWQKLVGSTLYLARSFSPTPAFNAEKAQLILRRVGSPGALTLELCRDSSGLPGVVLKSLPVTTTTITDWLSLRHSFDWSGVQSLSAGATYWLKVYDAAGTEANHWEIGVDTAASGLRSANGASWAATSGLHFRVVDGALAPETGFFFEYKRQLYCVTKPKSGASKLYLNGDRGVAKGAQSSNQFVDTAKSWTVNDWAGCVILLTNGAGAGQSLKIASNDASALNLAGAWPVLPVSATTEYVILGSDKWTDAGITLSAPVTSVCVRDGIVYFALGDSVNIRRMREYNNAGTWTRENVDDGTNKAKLLLTAFDDSGNLSVWRANNDLVTIAKAAPATVWGTNLLFGTATKVGDTETPIAALEYYDSKLYVGKEDGLWKLTSGIPGVVTPMLRDERNCINMRAWNTQLYFPFLTGLERLFGSTIDDIGPNRDSGLPALRLGRAADFRPVLQRGFLAWDGGEANQSAVMVTTAPGGDWHELWRSDVGERITTLFYQSIPLLANRLWLWAGADICWLVMPDDTYSALNDPTAEYNWEGYLTSAWYDLSTPDLDHLFDELRVYSRNLSAANAIRVEVDYQIDSDTDSSAWRRLSGSDFVDSPHQILTIGNGAVTGQKWRYRLRLLTSSRSLPAVITAVELRANVVTEPTYDYVIDVRLEDNFMLLQGQDARKTNALEAINVLLRWQERAAPLTLRSAIAAFDNAKGHIDPVSLAPVDWSPTETRMVGSLTFKVVDKTIDCTVIGTGDVRTVESGEQWAIARCLQVDGQLVVAGSVVIV